MQCAIPPIFSKLKILLATGFSITSTAPASSIFNDPASISYTSEAFPCSNGQRPIYLTTSNYTSPSSTLPLPPFSLGQQQKNLIEQRRCSSQNRLISSNSPPTYIAQTPPDLPENYENLNYSFNSNYHQINSPNISNYSKQSQVYNTGV